MLGCGSSDQEAGPSDNQESDVAGSALSEEGAALLQANGETLVYEHIQELPDFGSDVTTTLSETGALGNDEFQRYARPFAFSHEALRYNFSAWDMPSETGGRRKGVHVTTTAPGPALVTTPVQPATMDNKLSQQVAAGAEDARVLVRIRDFPDWDVPLVPPPALVSLSELADAVAAKQLALDGREALFDSMVAPVEGAVVNLGGSVHGRMWGVGWFSATIPVSAIPLLLAHPAVDRIASASVDMVLAADKSDIRPNELVGVQEYWDNGNFGDQTNPTRHSIDGIAIGIIEAGPIKDEHRAFCDNASCTATKFHSKWRCDNASSFYCSTVTNYPAALENMSTDATDHATTVMGAAVTDYLDGQDTAITGADALSATSGPREAVVVSFGALGGFSTFGTPDTQAETFTEALQWANYLELDVIAGGTGFAGNGFMDPDLDEFNCDYPPWGDGLADTPYGAAAENAFDGGAFLSIAPGNFCGASGGDVFATGQPADLPKVFAVTGIDPRYSLSNYYASQLDANASVRGPAPADINGTIDLSALSFVDMAVPQRVSDFPRCTVAPGDLTCAALGFLDTLFPGDFGTSFAAPRLGGFAALAKDWFIGNGDTWFNNPGWLHTYMLAMGDAFNGSGQNDEGADDLWGMGRVKLRHPGLFTIYGHDFRSYAYTSTTSTTYFVGNGPLPANAEILKCVAIHHEDMSHKTDIGEIRLDVKLRQPTRSGACSTSTSLVDSNSDASHDVKKMVAFRDAADLGGNCAEVTIDVEQLPSSGSLWAQAFCYTADEVDNAPN